ncbi:MAG: DNA adenine methylase [Acetobacter sp.]|nr:DNA adenine methylase [Acetobacter sp.]
MGKIIKSPLRYPGGKSRAISFLQAYFLPYFEEYREPFFGGGSVGIFISQIKQNITIKANDLNYDLYCFWTSLKKSPSSLIKTIRTMKERYQIGRDLYNFILSRRHASLTELQRGADFFILNRITFSGVTDSGGYSQRAYEERFTESSIDRLLQTHAVINNFTFDCADFSSLINEEGKNVFMFLDPPYYSASKSKLYGKNGDLHSGFDHEELLKCLQNTNHKFLLTYDDSDYIRQLYKDFYLLEWSLQYGMNNYKQLRAQKGKELLISNYPIKRYSCNDLYQYGLLL